jgi:hypothetical protein
MPSSTRLQAPPRNEAEPAPTIAHRCLCPWCIHPAARGELSPRNVAAHLMSAIGVQHARRLFGNLKRSDLLRLRSPGVRSYVPHQCTMLVRQRLLRGQCECAMLVSQYVGTFSVGQGSFAPLIIPSCRSHQPTERPFRRPVSPLCGSCEQSYLPYDQVSFWPFGPARQAAELTRKKSQRE